MQRMKAILLCNTQQRQNVFVQPIVYCNVLISKLQFKKMCGIGRLYKVHPLLCTDTWVPVCWKTNFSRSVSKLVPFP